MNNYERFLIKLTDEIYERALEKFDWDWRELAQESGLCYQTVYRLGMRITKYPRLQTFYKLSKAVGLDVSLIEKRIRMKRAG